MEIQYQRNLKNSYMVVIESERPLNPDGELAERMLQRQQISGLLTWVSMEHGKHMTFWYQITGMQSLTDHLQQHPMDHRLLQGLLVTLLELQEELPRYYLKPEHLLLRAEQIFIDAGGGQVRLCYEPMWEQEPGESLRELLEQLLPHIDHSDKAAVALAYGLYEICQQPNADIWQYVWEQAQPDTEEEPAAAEVFYPSEPSDGRIADAAESTQTVSLAAPAGSTSTAPDPVGSLPDRIASVRMSGDLFRHASDFAQHWKELSEKYKKFRKKDKTSQPEAIYLFEPEEETAACEHPTVYLGAGTHPEGRLTYQGGGTQPGFEVTGESFLIGGAHGQADGRIKSSGVSRSHARITREEDAYYIEDLNSRNGTYLNGELLLYRQKRRLKSGDHLRFAQEEYIFY